MTTYPSALDQIMGRLFDKPVRWRGKPPSGRAKTAPSSRGRSSARNILRAWSGRSSAVFKLIKSGGTSSRAGLKGQLEYVFGKADRVVSDNPRYHQAETLDNADMNRITRAWEGDWWGNAKAGHTTHMLLSYPIGTSAEDVAQITKAVCNEILESGDVTYQYVAGVHTDRDHPHAHIILNRRGSDNKLFTLRQGSELNYQTFREAMVAHGERHGVQMHAASRFEQGKIHRAPTVHEIYAAKEEERPPRERERVGNDLAFARERVGETQDIIRSMNVLAGEFNLTALEITLSRMETAIHFNEDVTKRAVFFTEQEFSEAERYDKTLTQIAASIDRLDEKIAALDEAERATVERQYSDILADISQINPDTDMARELAAPAGETSPYAEAAIKDVSVFDSADIRARLDEATNGTGIDANVLIERMRTGAHNQYLEQNWMLNDLENFAAARGIDLSQDENFQEAQAGLIDVYANLRTELVEIGALERHVEAVKDVTESTIVTRSLYAERAIAAFADGNISLDTHEQDALRQELSDIPSEDEVNRLTNGDLSVLERFSDDADHQAFIALQFLEGHNTNENHHVLDQLRGQVADHFLRQRGDDEDVHGE